MFTGVETVHLSFLGTWLLQSEEQGGGMHTAVWLHQSWVWPHCEHNEVVALAFSQTNKIFL